MNEAAIKRLYPTTLNWLWQSIGMQTNDVELSHFVGQEPSLNLNESLRLNSIDRIDLGGDGSPRGSMDLGRRFS